MPAASSPRTTVYLHIGPPKTGTTFIQGVLRQWHEELREVGVLFPAAPTLDHFNAALDLRGSHSFGFGRGRDTERPRARGAWQRLVRATHEHAGTVVISHELFATADAAHVRRAVADLAGTDLHVIVTVRDPARQVVSAWQERIKHGSTQRFRRVRRQFESGRGLASRAQDIPALLERWSQGVPPEHVHVVTVPPGGADPTLLWQRFAGVIGVDPAAFDPARAPRANESLGVAEIELLRRVNVALDGRIAHPAYSQIVTRLYAHRILTESSSSPPPKLPRGLSTRMEKLADEWIAQVQSHGYDVRGDLEDLRPRRRAGRPPPRTAEAAVSAAAVRATADLLVTVAELHQPRQALRSAARTTASRLGVRTVSASQSLRRLPRRLRRATRDRS